jgi:Fe2+ transport system protein FeoA
MQFLMLQLTGSRKERTEAGDLAGLRRGDSAIIERIDLPGPDARRLMELGFLPGTRVTVGRSAPSGDPRVFEVDGSEIALRRETALRIGVRPLPPPEDSL